MLACALLVCGACAAGGARAISTDAAPRPIGPYSQAVVVGSVAYLAGQIGIDPRDGELVAGGILAETRQTFANLQAVLDAAGFARSDVVDAQVFLVDLGAFAAFNEAYAEFFEGHARPARATVQVAALPKGAQVEVKLTAAR